MSFQHPLVAVLSIVLLLFGCTSRAVLPELDYKVKEPDWVELMNNSDFILLGSVLGSEELGPIRSFGSDPRRVQLQKVHLSVEYVLKGSTTKATIAFYRYALAGPLVNAPGPDFLSLGDRGVFFLNRTKDILRAALDVGPSRLPVWTGIDEPTFSQFESLPLPEQIARLMLTPGPIGSEEDMAAAIRTSGHIGSVLGRAKMVSILKPLLQGPSAVVSATACLELSSIGWGQDSCLADVAKDKTLPKDLRRSVQDTMERRAKVEPKMIAEFVADPTRWLSHEVDDAANRCDVLAMLIEHPNTKVAQAARGVLVRDFPEYGRSGCPPLHRVVAANVSSPVSNVQH